MSKAIPTNTAASAKQRLLNRARAKKEDFNLLLTKYALERVLYRISQSSHKDTFVLKGALLFELWTEQTHWANSAASVSPPAAGLRLQRGDQHIVQPLRTIDRLTAQLQQRTDTLVDLCVGLEQILEIAFGPVKPALVVIHLGLHQKPRYPGSSSAPSPRFDHRAPVAQYTAPVPDLGRSHVALGKKVTAQAIGDLACINLVVLLLGRSNRSKHQRMRNLHLLGMRKQMIVNPSREDRRFHGDRPGLWQGVNPGIQLAPGRSDLAFPVHLTSRILHAVADRLLVNVKSDVVHIVSEEPPWCSLNQRPLSSAFL